MKTTITTTITTDIDLDTFVPTHRVEIDAEDELPTQVIYAAVLGGLNASRNSVAKKVGLDSEEGDE